jgi:hypothetical protein
MIRCFSVSGAALAAWLVLALASPARADCYPFEATGIGVTVSTDGHEATDVVEGTAPGLGHWTAVADRVTHGTKVQISTTMTAADGDLLFLDIEGTEGADGFSGTYTITGGTGRFEGATGSGSNTATSNPDGTFTVVFDGTICIDD